MHKKLLYRKTFRIKLSIYLSNFTLIDETQEMDIDSNVELVKADARGFCKLCRNKGKSKSSSFYFAIDAHGLCIKTVFIIQIISA